MQLGAPETNFAVRNNDMLPRTMFQVPTNLPAFVTDEVPVFLAGFVTVPNMVFRSGVPEAPATSSLEVASGGHLKMQQTT